LQITGGTGRFDGPSCALMFTVASAYPILFDVTGQHAVLTVIRNGMVTGTIVLKDAD
jgi:hypothetical protein